MCLFFRYDEKRNIDPKTIICISEKYKGGNYDISEGFVAGG